MADPTTVSTFSPASGEAIQGVFGTSSSTARPPHGAYPPHLSCPFCPICPGADHLHMAAQLSACEPTRGRRARVRRAEASRRRHAGVARLAGGAAWRPCTLGCPRRAPRCPPPRRAPRTPMACCELRALEHSSSLAFEGRRRCAGVALAGGAAWHPCALAQLDVPAALRVAHRRGVHHARLCLNGGGVARRWRLLALWRSCAAPLLRAHDPAACRTHAAGRPPPPPRASRAPSLRAASSRSRGGGVARRSRSARLTPLYHMSKYT
ncbi:hypothetical protein GGX14DRAFT_573441 [Mycena pura]|uniref:Uncharacterized protein n=1 Tax=Mycena pura TaxID=153505 RepID=A0AAD6UYZ7_9AGAR|nr:hypothetical protein GGX14DRAFT_573441 [Mycena pura]